MVIPGGSPYAPPMVTVALYGRSLALSSIGAGLEPRAWLRLVPLDAPPPELARQLEAVEANVVIFDIASAHPDALALWRSRPNLLLIGVDMASDDAIVLSRTSTRVATTNQLLHIIRGARPVESNA